MSYCDKMKCCKNEECMCNVCILCKVDDKEKYYYNDESEKQENVKIKHKISRLEDFIEVNEDGEL